MIEIVVVMVIIAVAAALVTPSIRAGARQREVRRTLQHMQSIIRRASATAILRRKRVELRVRSDTGEIVLAVLQAGPPQKTGARVAAAANTGDEASNGFVIRERFVLSSLASFGDIGGGRLIGNDEVVFDFFPTGGSSGGRIEVYFGNSPGEQGRQAYAMAFDPLTSRIRMEDVR